MAKQCIRTTVSHKSLPSMHNRDALSIKSSVYGVHITYETIKHMANSGEAHINLLILIELVNIDGIL
jgi:hypothetical protein